MKALAALFAALLIAGCGPSVGIPAAVARPGEAARPLHPAVDPGAAEGDVFEYH